MHLMFHGIFYRTEKYLGNRAKWEVLSSQLMLNPSQQKITESRDTDYWLVQINSAAQKYTVNQRLKIIGWARLDNRQSLGKQLGVSSEDLLKTTCLDLIYLAYQHFQERCIDYLFGDFAFAVFDEKKNSFFCARDHMGIKPFYYYVDEDVFVFSASMSMFHRMPMVSLKPSAEWASKYLISPSLSMDFEKTAYRNIFKLMPSHYIAISKKRCDQKRYFSFHTNKIQIKHSEDYVAYYQEYLDKAVKSRVSVDHPLGSELSGGIDSSTVTAYAVRHYPGSLANFHAFGFASFSEEPKRILSVSQHLGIPMTHVCCNPQYHDIKPQDLLNVFGAPHQHGNAVSHQYFYQLCQQFDIKTLLSGFGGDEFVTTIHGYLHLHELLRDKKYSQLFKQHHGHFLKKTARFVKFLAKNRCRAGIKTTNMLNAFIKRWPDYVVSEKWNDRHGLEKLYLKNGIFDYGYADLDQFTLEKRLMPFIGTRTEECTLMAASFGVDYRWPLLDVQLIQCFLSIPSSEKFHQGEGRYLHRRAIQSMVPKEIYSQNSKYMGEKVSTNIPDKPEICQLNENLHSDILELIDKNKLLKQEKYLNELIEQRSNHFHSPELIPIKSNIRSVNALDYWLKTYFPHGASWEL